METRDPGAGLSPEQAQKALEIADAEESATINRPVPRWYYPTLAVLVLALFVLNAITESIFPMRVITVALVVGIALVIAVLVGRVSFSHTGYRGVRLRWRSIAFGVALAAVLVATPLIFEDVVGSWVWVVCGILLSAMIAGFGTSYWRSTRG